MTMLGAYQVLQKLGEGGMGEVLLGLAPDRSLVVLKVPLHPSAETTARLRDEARVGFRLQHPNIVRTRDFFMAGTKPVLVIDFVDGASLKDLREQKGALPPAMVAQVGRQIASALSFIHTATDEQGRPLNMLHRDVTPGNILVNRQGQALLIDLGIARSDENTAGKTSTGILKGTFRYLCPDLFTGSNYSSGTDLWALGVTLFESAMGRKAATGGQQLVLAAIIGGRIMQLQAHETLHPLLHKTFHSLLRTDDASRRITDASQLERVFAGIADKLGDGDAEARAVMRGQPQGDVSGEFGADDLVPTIYDERGLSGVAGFGGVTGPSASDVFAPLPRPPTTPSPAPAPSAAHSAAAGLPPAALPATALPAAIPRPHAAVVVDDLQGPTMLLPQQPAAPQHPPRPPVAVPAPLPTLQIPIFVVEDDIDLSDLDGPAPAAGLPTLALPAVHAPKPFSAMPALGALPTIALPAVPAPGAVTSSDAPPTVALPAAVLPSAFAPATVVAMPQAQVAHAPSSSDAPLTMIMSPSVAASMSVPAPTPAAPTSEDAPATMIVAAHHLPPTPQRPAPTAPPRPAPRPTLELPIFVDDDIDNDPPRE